MAKRKRYSLGSNKDKAQQAQAGENAQAQSGQKPGMKAGSKENKSYVR